MRPIERLKLNFVSCMLYGMYISRVYSSSCTKFTTGRSFVTTKLATPQDEASARTLWGCWLLIDRNNSFVRTTHAHTLTRRGPCTPRFSFLLVLFRFGCLLVFTREVYRQLARPTEQEAPVAIELQDGTMFVFERKLHNSLFGSVHHGTKRAPPTPTE